MTHLLILAVGLCAGPSSAQSPEQAPVEASTSAAAAATSSAAAASANPLALKARGLYFTGDSLKAAEAFESAVKIGKSTESSTDWRVWADGAIAWAEAGRPDKAVIWQRRAAALNDRAEARPAVVWALLRPAAPAAADAEFPRAIAPYPHSPFALPASGRATRLTG